MWLILVGGGTLDALKVQFRKEFGCGLQGTSNVYIWQIVFYFEALVCWNIELGFAGWVLNCQMVVHGNLKFINIKLSLEFQSF